jgi:hypothetical protein
MSRDKYNTKLDGVEVCNTCYAMALGYSQRRFKQLKWHTKNSYLTNYGQKANLWTFWTFSYGGKLRILGGNRGVRAVWTRILPRGMRNIERT